MLLALLENQALLSLEAFDFGPKALDFGRVWRDR